MNYQIYNENIELQILGCLLINESLWKEFKLKPQHFSNSFIKSIIEDLYSIKDNKKDDHNLNLFYKISLDERKKYYVDLAMDSVVSISSFDFYQEKQLEHYKANLISKGLKKYVEGNIDYEKLSSYVNKTLNLDLELKDVNTKLSKKEILDLITTNREEIVFKRFTWMQNKLNLPKRTLNIIAARSSIGKSAFALNLIDDLSINYKCIYFNMEMTEKEIYQRLMALDSNVKIKNFTNMNSNEEKAISRSLEYFSKKDIEIYNGSKNVNSIRSILSRKARKGHCIVFIDYVGYIHNGKNQNDRERIGEIVREIQTMTKDLDVTIFLVAQINREGASQAPELKNLKDSGELEQSAHCVISLYDKENNITNLNPIIEVLVLKNRSGLKGKLKMKFSKETQKFEREY